VRPVKLPPVNSAVWRCTGLEFVLRGTTTQESAGRLAVLGLRKEANG